MEKRSYSRKHRHYWPWDQDGSISQQDWTENWYTKNAEKMFLKLEQDEKSVCTGFEVLKKLATKRLSKKRWSKAAPSNREVRTASENCWN